MTHSRDRNRKIGLCEDCGKLALVGTTNENEVYIRGKSACQDCESQEFTVVRSAD